MRVVVDTNVLISALFWTGKPRQVLNRVRKGSITLVTSMPVLEELKEVVMRPDKPFRLSAEEALALKEHVSEMAETVRTSTRLNVCAHEQDNRVLECAVDGAADYVVTGDSHLLDLSCFGEIRIVRVTDLLTLLEQEGRREK